MIRSGRPPTDGHSGDGNDGADRRPETPSLGERPLRGEIALCLSGGGYRAAAFHLGALDTLDRLNLRERVRVLSSLSGGAIVAARYATALAEQQPFPDFFESFRTTLRDCNPMARAFDALPGSGGGREAPSLIRSLADAYAQPDFLGEHRFGELMSSETAPTDLLFGATEFHTGKAYRFQLSRRSRPWVGNAPPLDIPSTVAADLRLADIVAASSCFPAAFEPIMFPDDFRWSRPLAEIRTELGEELGAGLPLMDGGIYDNQGVDGALAVYRRAGTDPGLLLICDTSPRVANLYHRPGDARRGGPRLSTLRRIGQGFFVGALLSALALVVKGVTDYLDDDLRIIDGILFGLPVVVCLALALALRAVDRRLDIEQRRIREATSVQLWPNLSRLRLLDLLDLLNARFLSLVSLTSDIFMKRVRGLIQSSLRIGERYRHRVVSNLIYDLDRSRRTLYEQHPWIEPTESLAALAREAEAMPSTLWFQDEEQLDRIILCGRATTCFSLLEYLLENESEALEDPDSPESRLLERGRALWSELNRDDTVANARRPGPGD